MAIDYCLFERPKGASLEISYLGANCISLSSKSVTALIDPNVPGLDVDTKKADIIITTFEQGASAKDEQLLINTPGEYEAKGISVKGTPARGHRDEEGKQTATMYRIDVAGFRLAVVGHIHPDLSDEQLEALGTVDILVVPVGGNGYTLDANGAAGVIRAVEPFVVIPTHYADSAVRYEVPQAELQLFIDELGAPTQNEDRYKVKDGSLPEQLTVVVLSRTT